MIDSPKRDYLSGKGARSNDHPAAPHITQLIGKFFHIFDDDGTVSRQGHVTGAILPDLLIVEYFEWLIGQPSDEIIVRLEDLISPVKGWPRFTIYDNAEDMNRMWGSETEAPQRCQARTRARGRGQGRIEGADQMPVLTKPPRPVEWHCADCGHDIRAPVHPIISGAA